MIKYFGNFKKVYFKNILIFKGKYEIPLENQGIISVIGRNLDTGSSNGAGKSTLFDIMRAIHIGSNSVGIKDISFMANSGASYMGYEANYGKDKYEITKYRGDKLYKNNTIVFKNEKAIGAKKNTNDIKKAISTEYVKIPETVWDNCVILRTDKAHTLINGSPSERVEFLSNLCQLNCYDDIELILKDKLKELSEKIDGLRESEAIYADISKSLSESKSKEDLIYLIDKTKSKLEELCSKYSSFRNKQKALNEKFNSLTDIMRYEDIYNTSSKKISKKLKDVSDLLRVSRKKSEECSKVIYAYDDYVSKRNELKKFDAKKFEDIEDIYTIDSKLNSLNKEKEKSLKARKLKKYISDNKDISYDKEFEDKLLQNKSRFNLMLQLSNGSYKKCPVCSSTLSKVLSIDKNALKEDLLLIERKLNKVKANKEIIDNINTCKKELKELGEVKDLSKLNDSIDLYENKKENATKLKNEYKEYNSLKDYVKRIKEKENFDSIDIVKDNYEKIEKFINKSSDVIKELSEKLSKITLVESIEKKYDVSRFNSEKEISYVSKKLKKYDSLITNVSDKKDSNNKKLGNYEESLRSVKELLNKKVELEDKLKDVSIMNKKKVFLSNLVYAYGNNGLKALKINKILEALKIKLQEYTSVLFSEKDIAFDIKGDNRSFSIMCIRKDSFGKEIARYDVKGLSSGEKARFVLAIVFALDDISCPNKKVNFKVLDEIDAKLDEAGKRVLLERFIPILKKKTSTLLIVSHDPDVRDSDIYDGKLIVTKKNATSTLKYIRKEK